MIRRLTTILTILTIFAVPMPGAASAQTSSSACLALPIDTAEGWTDLFPCCGDEKQCRYMCGQWLRTCNTMAQTSYRCFVNLFRSLAGVDLAECTVQENPASKAECAAITRNNQDSSNSSLSDNLQEALFICDDNLDDCIDNCLGDD